MPKMGATPRILTLTQHLLRRGSNLVRRRCDIIVPFLQHGMPFVCGSPKSNKYTNKGNQSRTKCSWINRRCVEMKHHIPLSTYSKTEIRQRDFIQAEWNKCVDTIRHTLRFWKMLDLTLDNISYHFCLVTGGTPMNIYRLRFKVKTAMHVVMAHDDLYIYIYIYIYTYRWLRTRLQ